MKFSKRRRKAAARRYVPCARAKSSVRVPKIWVRTPILGRFWLRGSREGWASHFLSRAIPFIIEFVSGSHVAELIQHQKVIDYTATYTMATTAIFGLLRPSTRISRGHTPPHGQTPSGPHTAAHRLALTIAAWARQHCWKQHAVSLMLEHLDEAR